MSDFSDLCKGMAERVGSVDAVALLPDADVSVGLVCSDRIVCSVC